VHVLVGETGYEQQCPISRFSKEMRDVVLRGTEGGS
jgi:hypothetical protein